MFNLTAVWGWAAAEPCNLKLCRISLIFHLPPPKDQRPGNLQGQAVKACSDFSVLSQYQIPLNQEAIASEQVPF